MAQITGTVTIYYTYYLMDEVSDGDFLPNDTVTETHENLTPLEAAAIIIGEGLSFEATGSDWAADPDGSYAVDYAIGRECKASAHLSGFPERITAAIMRKVG